MSRHRHKLRQPRKDTKALGVKMLGLEGDDRAWDEKDDSEEEDEMLEARTAIQCHEKARQNRTRNQADGEEGINYPLDLWFLISEYILPEDVVKFACLCQATLYITTTARFWLTMHRRWYKMVPELPLELTPWNIDAERGLRAAVVRSLFFTYDPFVARIAAEKPLNADPTTLLRSQCLLQWHIKDGSLHKYFFKFCLVELQNGFGSAGRKPGRSWRRDISVTYNSEAGCYILEATSSSVCEMSMVMGERLYHAGLGVSANLLHHRLRLSLVPAHLLPPVQSAPTRKYQVPATEIILDPVLDVRLYPWWHPQYQKVVPGA